MPFIKTQIKVARYLLFMFLLPLACGRQPHFDLLSEDSYVYNYNLLAKSRGFSASVKALAKKDLKEEITSQPEKALKEILSAFREDRRNFQIQTLNIFLVGPRGLDTLQFPQTLAEKVVQDTNDLPSELKGRTVLELDLPAIVREAQKLKLDNEQFLAFLGDHIGELKAGYSNPIFVFSNLELVGYSSLRQGVLSLQSFLRQLVDWDIDTFFLVTPAEYDLHIAGRVLEAESTVVRSF